RTTEQALNAEGGTVVLGGNLAPDGAVIKHTAASAELLRHRGRAFVFDNHRQMLDQIDREDLPVDASSVLVLKNGGPIGGPGMPEWGHIPMPAALLRKGVKDMVRISDARMSGTSFGTIVLHIAPESAIGGPLAAVETGDEITLDIEARRIDLNLDDAEISRRLARFSPPAPHYHRGYGALFLRHVTQAHLGCDFDFLRAVQP
ncbi:MAG: dihydroxy-acid dehydratase, partial [Bryobacteraceae bacterium]